ncbi:MAG: thrombospondin type 3 repeat-containing protein, partial [Patescibacteria group bacterium]
INIVVSRRGSYTRDERVAMEQRLRVQLDTCRLAQDPEICRRQAVIPQAELLKDTELCALLDGEAKVGCVETVAKVTLDRGDCQPLDGENQVRCEDAVTILKATETLNLAVCREMHDEAKRVMCIDQVTARVIDDGSCLEHGVDEALCSERAAFTQALGNGDVTACDRLSDQGAVASCKDEVRKTMSDPDEDAVEEAGEEALDSDGDGYSDEEEIQNGFDPFGPGRIQ